jgi:hypothetical protein
VRIEPRRGQPGEAGLGECRAIELEERRGDGMKAEGIAVLQHDTGKLAPDFDDERLVMDSLLDHGPISLVAADMVTIRRKGNGGCCRIRPDHEQISRVRHQYGGRNFFGSGISHQHDGRMKACPFD